MKNQFDFYKNDYPVIVDKFFDIFSDFDDLPASATSYMQIEEFIEERPDFIDEDVWDAFFIKKYEYDALRNSIFGSFSFNYCEIEGITIAIVTYHGCTTTAFCFKGTCELTSDSSSVSVIKQRVLNKYEDYNFNDKLKYLYNGAVDFYGISKVKLVVYELEKIYNSPKTGINILIWHDPIWVKDEFGFKMKLERPLSLISLSGRSNISRILFTDAKRDALKSTVRICHPHCSSTGSPLDYMDICRGSNTPINAAMSAFTDNPTLDSAFNFYINLETLLCQESREGGPYRFMRHDLIQIARSSERPRITKDNLLTGLKSGNLKYSVDVNSSQIIFDINNNHITDYISYLSDGNEETDRIYSVPDNLFFKKELKIPNTRPRTYYSFDFNGRKCTYEISEHNPDVFDMSEFNAENEHLENVYYRSPRESDVEDIRLQVQSNINKELIEKGEIINYEYSENIEEELLGLTRVKRGADISNLVST